MDLDDLDDGFQYSVFLLTQNSNIILSLFLLIVHLGAVDHLSLSFHREMPQGAVL